MIDVSERTAFLIFILSFIGWGPFIGSILDKKGCNWTMFFLGFVPILPVCVTF